MLGESFPSSAETRELTKHSISKDDDISNACQESSTGFTNSQISKFEGETPGLLSHLVPAPTHAQYNARSSTNSVHMSRHQGELLML